MVHSIGGLPGEGDNQMRGETNLSHNAESFVHPEAPPDNTRSRVPGAARAQCPNCLAYSMPGELVCARCGILFSIEGKTKKIDDTGNAPISRLSPVGEAFVGDRKPIIFEVDSIPVTLPPRDTIVVGRVNDAPGDRCPDVDLNAFQAGERGVSRLHLKITRVQELIYVMDLDSTNGTYLNGRRLVHRCPRILRNGDELRLGHLTIRVRF
jgi:FHA domain